MSDICTTKSIDKDKLNNIEDTRENTIVLDNMVNMYKLFGDKTRLNIISLLIVSELCVCEIEELLGLSQSLISHQLRKLKDGNVVITRKEGKKVFYSLKDEHIKDIYSICANHIKHC